MNMMPTRKQLPVEQVRAHRTKPQVLLKLAFPMLMVFTSFTAEEAWTHFLL